MAKTKPIHTLPCSVENCNGVIGDQSITGLCPRCYSSLHSWQFKKNARERVARANALNLYINRLMYLLPDDKVELLNQRKKYKPLAILPGQVKKYRKKTKYKTVAKQRVIVGSN